MRVKQLLRWLDTLAKRRRRTEIRWARPIPHLVRHRPTKANFTIVSDAYTTGTAALVADRHARLSALVQGRTVQLTFRSDISWRGSRRALREVGELAMTEYFDADGHALEPRDLFVKNLPKRSRELAVRVEWSDELNSDMLLGEGRVILESGVAAAGLAERPWPDFARGVRYDPQHIAAGGFEPAARMPDMARHGIDVSMVFPTLGLVLSALNDPQVADDHCRVENDWLAGYCAAEPGRLFGVATLPMQDVDLAVREARRAVNELGLRGAMVRPNPYGPHHLHDPVFDRLWSTLQELDIPLCLHPGGAEEMWGFFRMFRDYPIAPSLGFGFALAFSFDAQFTWSLLVGGGVLDRFPRLRVAIMETGGGWMANWLVRMDHFNEVYEWAQPRLVLRPSEYFRRQGWIAFDPDEVTLAATADIVGCDRIVWASDYPHQDLRSSCVRDDLDENIRGLPTYSQQAIRSENARRLYGL